MKRQSIDAYDLPQRVASYDADMDLMHPNRSKMVRVALQILPYLREAPLWALDLGAGTGEKPPGRTLRRSAESSMAFGMTSTNMTAISRGRRRESGELDSMVVTYAICGPRRAAPQITPIRAHAYTRQQPAGIQP
ncbi:MAG: hypothetical protein WCE48_04890 [Steroidobacteraceae bacterium]